MLDFENYGFQPSSPYGAEFHQWLIFTCRVETDGHVLGPVRVDEEQAPQLHSLGIECWTARPVGTDVGRGVGQQQRLLQRALPLSSRLLSISSHHSSREQNDVGRARSGFYRAATNSQYDVSYQLDIAHNLSSADSTLTNRRGNARFWLRRQIWETCDMAMYTSVCDSKR